MKSTDMKQTPETRKNFEDGWDAIFNKDEKGTIKESLTVAMEEVVAHLKGEIELPSRVYHTDAHNVATEYHPDGHRGFIEMMQSMESIKSAAIDNAHLLGKTCGNFRPDDPVTHEGSDS